MNVFLIRMTNHTHSQNFEARWEALTGTASEADYTHTTASQTSNDSQTLENRMGRSFPTTTDALIEGAETFTIKARGGETQGEFNSNDDLRCQITIIDLYVTQINMVSTPSSGDIYRIGETIEFSATFNTEVEVEGTVNMGFYIGDQWKGANYRRGSGTKDLAFEYIFSAGIPIIMASPSSLAARTAVGLAVGPSGPCSHRAMPVERK